MTDEELSISDATLIARLRWKAGAYAKEAADRIEKLVATNEALVKERDQWIEHTKNAVWADSEELKLANARAEQLAATCERLEALLREARTDLEDYVTQEYPKHAHPYFERQWNRDMELCRRIDAALKGD